MSNSATPSASDVRSHALRLLSRREYSVGELVDKLRKKWGSSVVVGEVVASLEAEDLVSDSRFAEAFVRSRIARFQGPRKIRAQLAQRFVTGSQSDAAVHGAGCDWTRLAAEWVRRQSGETLDHDARAAYYRRLVNRGFTHDQAMDAVNSRYSAA